MINALSILLIHFLFLKQASCGGSRLQLFVRGLDGNSQVAVDIDSDATVGDLLQMMDLQTFALSYGGQQLEEESVLSEAGIGAEAVLQITDAMPTFDPVRLRSGGAQTETGDQRFSFALDDWAHCRAFVVTNSKKYRFELTQFDPANSKITIGIKKKHDSFHIQQVFDYEFKQGDIIKVEAVEEEGTDGKIAGINIAGGEENNYIHSPGALRNGNWEFYVGVTSKVRTCGKLVVISLI